jgi:SPP1 gp7 family putative phage head morphogenesis protein
MIEGALKADGRLAAKNAVKIRAALHQVADFKRVFKKYQETMPQPTDNPTQDRVRARSWLILNVYLNDEPLRLAVTRAWQEAFILGEVAADEWLGKTREAKKADDIEVNWDTWKPGDVDTALNIKNFQKYLAKVNADSYFKKFNKETITNFGTAISDAIAAGLDAESAAVMIGKYVADPSRALTIAITEQNRAMSFSTIERYKEAGLARMEWAVSDPCDICAKNDGQVIQIGQTFASGDQQPPAHPHCRCVLLPVIPGMEDELDPTGITGGLTPMPDGAAIVEPSLQLQTAGTPATWSPMTSERWVERRQAERVKNGLPPYTGNQLKILEDQANDATAMWERGPHVVRWDKSSTKIDQPHVDGFMKHFDEAISKLPEWRRFDENGVERGFAAVLSSEASGNTLAYTYLGNNTMWFSNTIVMKSLDEPGVKRGIVPTGHKMPAQNVVNETLYTIAHELGHTVDSNANNQIRGRFTGPLRRKFAELWSRYSRQDPDEAYAEVFAQWLVGEHNALTDLYAKKFGWNLTGKQYRDEIAVQWVANFRSQNIGG